MKKIEKNKRKKHTDLMCFDRMSMSTGVGLKTFTTPKLGLQEKGIYTNPHYAPLVPLCSTPVFAPSSPYMSFPQYEQHTTTLPFRNYI